MLLISLFYSIWCGALIFVSDCWVYLYCCFVALLVACLLLRVVGGFVGLSVLAVCCLMRLGWISLLLVVCLRVCGLDVCRVRWG